MTGTDLGEVGGDQERPVQGPAQGLDASDPAFWDKGLGVIRRFIDELEALG